MNKKVILIGLTPQGLSLLRVMSRAGLNVTAFTMTKSVAGYYSRYGERILFKNIDDLKFQIEGILKTINCKPVCYIASGELLALILSEYSELYDACQVISGTYQTVKKLAHKDIMYGIALSKGLNVAKFYTLDKYIEGSLNYPLYIKRNYEIPLFFKAACVRTKDELNVYLDKITDKSIYEHIILQEHYGISTNELIEISCQAYFVNGQPKGFLITDQKRRLNQGLTSFIEEITDKELLKKVIDLTTNFMAGIDYTGFSEFEFAYNKVTHEFFFIEVNTRTCGLQSSLNYKFKNLKEVFLNPFNPPELESTSGPVIWMNILRDIKVRFQKRYFKRFIRDLYRAQFDILDFYDIKPFFAPLLKTFVKRQK